eukprot:COSAG01_NODE_70721_length_258_cov_0.503145_1_plen_28_part_10
MNSLVCRLGHAHLGHPCTTADQRIWLWS